jgi:hypothetical protein
MLSDPTLPLVVNNGKVEGTSQSIIANDKARVKIEKFQVGQFASYHQDSQPKLTASKHCLGREAHR